MTTKQNPKEFLEEAFKAIDLRQELTEYSRQTLYNNVSLLQSIEANIRMRANYGTKEDLTNYLKHLIDRYKHRDQVLTNVLWMLDTYAPKEKEWFQKVLLLQP